VLVLAVLVVWLVLVLVLVARGVGGGGALGTSAAPCSSASFLRCRAASSSGASDRLVGVADVVGGGDPGAKWTEDAVRE
jgi:hypothetical protein